MRIAKDQVEAEKSPRTRLARGPGFTLTMSLPTLKALNSISCDLLYETGATLFSEDEIPPGVMLLRAGCARISMCSHQGKVMILRVARAGEVLGLEAVISNKRSQTRVESLSPCRVAFVGGNEFVSFLRSHGDASLAAAAQLSRNYDTACEQIRTLGLSTTVTERLARFLGNGCKAGRAPPAKRVAS